MQIFYEFLILLRVDWFSMKTDLLRKGKSPIHNGIQSFIWSIIWKTIFKNVMNFDNFLFCFIEESQ